MSCLLAVYGMCASISDGVCLLAAVQRCAQRWAEGGNGQGQFSRARGKRFTRPFRMPIKQRAVQSARFPSWSLVVAVLKVQEWHCIELCG